MRKALLAQLIGRSKWGIIFNQHTAADGRQAFAHACSLGAIGIVFKLADAPYQPGRYPARVIRKNPYAVTAPQSNGNVSPASERMRRYRKRRSLTSFERALLPVDQESLPAVPIVARRLKCEQHLDCLPPDGRLVPSKPLEHCVV